MQTRRNSREMQQVARMEQTEDLEKNVKRDVFHEFRILFFSLDPASV